MTESARGSGIGLDQLLATGVLPGYRVVAGDEALTRRVSDVVVTQRCDTTTSLTAGLLVILDARELEPNSYAFDVAVRMVSDASGAGLIIVNAIAPIGQATRRVAGRFGVAVVEAQAPDVLSAAQAAREIVMMPALHTAALVRSLLAALASSPSAKRAIAAVSNVLDRRCALVEANGSVIAGDDIEVGADGLTSLRRTGAELGAGLICPVLVVPGEAATLWLVCELLDGDNELRSTGMDLLLVASWAIGAHLAGERVERERDARYRLALLNEVVGGGELPDEMVLGQMATFGWSASGWVSAFHVQLSGEVDAAWVLVSTELFSSLLHDQGMQGPLIERTDGWSGWTTSSSEPTLEDYQSIAAALRAAMAGLDDIIPGVLVHGGVGRPALGLSGLRTSLVEARQAATLASASGDRVAVRHIDELGMQRIMLGWYGSAEFGRVASAFLEPLTQLDAAEDLLQTLETYLDHQSSATNAGAALRVHRNTVMKRIERVRRELDVDLHDPDQRLAIQLVLRMHRLDNR